ncbi:MAG: bifunctional oligoribonuclease/PAP phosphatase NrnA [Ruminococcaceae bacterium]|nr:bifunctional oligoribonuclease/PAP phosphatase NrnA [Oscillospiraceae bacterium]
MKIDVKKTAQLLENHNNIIILVHSNPDGDTLGCGYALLRALRKLGKKAEVLRPENVSKKYNYLFDDLGKEDFTPEYVVSVDVADIKLLEKDAREKYGDKINLAIDHHPSNCVESEYLLLEDTAAAACEIIYKVIDEMNVAFDKKIADCLYTGITTDTGCFRYSNTTSQTYMMAAKLVEHGADGPLINRIMFETKTKSYVILEKLVMDTLEMHFDGRCALVHLDYDMYEKSGSDESETDPIASKTRQIEGVCVGIFLREKEDGSFKISLRTLEEVNASEVCRKLDGGGHARAAGCQCDGPFENAKEKILAAVGEYLK